MINTFRRIRSELVQQRLGSNAAFIDGTNAFDSSADDYFFDEVHFANDKAMEVLLQHIVDQELQNSNQSKDIGR